MVGYIIKLDTLINRFKFCDIAKIVVPDSFMGKTREHDGIILMSEMSIYNKRRFIIKQSLCFHTRFSTADRTPDSKSPELGFGIDIK
jgi:hypothetical protein